jgi:phosphatidylinositol alpha 1,6-mannosyltransferase
MASLDVLVHPGGAETFCQVIQEALSSGVPVVTAARGGPLDLVRHGENGWLWAGDDPRELAALVVSIREDQTQLAAMRSRARASVAGRSWQRATDQVLVHYDNVLSSHRKPSGALAGGLRLLRPTPAGADLSG